MSVTHETIIWCDQCSTRTVRFARVLDSATIRDELARIGWEVSPFNTVHVCPPCRDENDKEELENEGSGY